jgi:hypothetical protein
MNVGSVNMLLYGDAVIVYAVVDDALSRDFPLGDALEVTKVLAGQARLTFPAESQNLSSCG